MNKYFLFVAIFFAAVLRTGFSQELPNYLTEEEKLMLPFITSKQPDKGYNYPPVKPVRNMAEWEEISSLNITWRSYTDVLSQIVAAAQLECKVIISCTDSNVVKSNLATNGVTPNANVKYLITPTNSVWCRDYSANPVYTYDVDSIYLVDWVYNRTTRPDDDLNPVAISNYLGLPLYLMTSGANKLVATGGNWMSDGFGNAFSSNLILDENSSSGSFGQNLTKTDIDTLVKKFLGIKRYVNFTNLPNDGIHHIDMHMKLLDEETMLLGQFPTGVSDGPQIEANLLYLMTNYNSVFNTPYKIVRIPMPPSTTGSYPPSSSYRTYTNGVFVNKSYIYPTYYQKYDTTAYRILKQNLSGYKLVPINCSNMISASGAIHCITHSVGVKNPLWISHQPLTDTYNSSTPYQVNAMLKHVSGVQNATIYYRTDTLLPYQSAPMTLTSALTNTWTGYIPAQAQGSTVYYYIQGQASNGKTQVRPITAPTGYWKFKVLLSTDNDELFNSGSLKMLLAFPNPASAITCIPIEAISFTEASIELYDILGKKVLTIFQGTIKEGTSYYFFNAAELSSGTYIVKFASKNYSEQQLILIK